LDIGGLVVLEAIDVNTPTVRIRAGQYINLNLRHFRAVVTNACGSVNSDAATLTICIGDADCDQDTDSDDIGTFFTAWDQGEPGGDTDGDGDTDSDDIIIFFAAWDSGC